MFVCVLVLLRVRGHTLLCSFGGVFVSLYGCVSGTMWLLVRVCASFCAVNCVVSAWCSITLRVCV